MLRLRPVFAAVVLIMMIAPRIIYGLVMPDRNILLNPLSGGNAAGGVQFFPAAGGWAELDRYPAGMGDRDHSFNTMLGAAAQVFRSGDDLDFTVSSDVQLVATPDSPILFNPRALFWQESFQFGAAVADSFLHLGYVHRCKHDVDNVEVQETTGEKRELVLIYDSFFARWISGREAMVSSERAPFITQVYIRADGFVLTTDERSIPRPDKNVTNLRYGLSAGLSSRMLRAGPGMIYARLQCSLYAFAGTYNPAGAGYREMSVDYSAEAGVVFPGVEGEVSLFINFEKQDMTMVNPQNEGGYFFSFGVRANGTDIYD